MSETSVKIPEVTQQGMINFFAKTSVPRIIEALGGEKKALLLKKQGKLQQAIDNLKAPQSFDRHTGCKKSSESQKIHPYYSTKVSKNEEV